jgi:hypothetical protein
MARTKMERVEKIRTEMAQLKKQEKELLKQHKKAERDARTKRLCTRHGMMEKHMPDLIKLTDREFETFIIRAINTTYGREALAKIIKQAEATATPNPADYAETTEDGVSANPQNPARSEA